MSLDGFSIGDIIPLSIAPSDNFTDADVMVRRRATGKYLDFADNTFKAAGTTATQTQQMTVQGEEWLYLWNTAALNDGGALSGEQNLSIEYTVDGELYLEDCNLGYVSAGGSGGMSTADFVFLTTNTVGAMPSQVISSLTTASLAALATTADLAALSTTATIAALETTILDAIQIISDENAYIKYRVRFPNKKGLHG
jgi:hypothetical protein